MDKTEKHRANGVEGCRLPFFYLALNLGAKSLQLKKKSREFEEQAKSWGATCSHNSSRALLLWEKPKFLLKKIV